MLINGASAWLDASAGIGIADTDKNAAAVKLATCRNIEFIFFS
jgi:hypothetical protein